MGTRRSALKGSDVFVNVNQGFGCEGMCVGCSGQNRDAFRSFCSDMLLEKQYCVCVTATVKKMRRLLK